MAQIAYGGIIGFLGGTSFTGNYYLTPEGYLSDSEGNPIGGETVFSDNLFDMHRTADVVILPDDWTSWAPDPLNAEWDSYSISSAPSVGTATLSAAGNIPGLDLLQDDYGHDRVSYTFDPSAPDWQALADGDTLSVTFSIFAQERGLFGNVNDSDTFEVTLNFTKAIVCFARGSLIQTQAGMVPVEELSVGTMVWTRDHGYQPIRWIGSKKLTKAALNSDPKNLPIRIKAGALGENIPASDLLVSPQHRILVRSKIAMRMFASDEVLVAAKQLLQHEGFDIAHDVEDVEYFHFLFDHHEIVNSNGAETESLYTGPEAIKSVGSAALKEIFSLFPELQNADYVPEAARFLPSGRQARKLAIRHIQHNRALIN